MKPTQKLTNYIVCVSGILYVHMCVLSIVDLLTEVNWLEYYHRVLSVCTCVPMLWAWSNKHTLGA